MVDGSRLTVLLIVSLGDGMVKYIFQLFLLLCFSASRIFVLVRAESGSLEQYSI